MIIGSLSIATPRTFICPPHVAAASQCHCEGATYPPHCKVLAGATGAISEIKYIEGTTTLSLR